MIVAHNSMSFAEIDSPTPNMSFQVKHLKSPKVVLRWVAPPQDNNDKHIEPTHLQEEVIASYP
jgi:hypothetical protein